MKQHPTRTTAFLSAPLLGAMALTVLAPQAARADEARPAVRGHVFLPEAQWGKLPAEAAGKRLYLEGRWLQLYGDWILLFKGPIETQGFLWVPEGPLKSVLAMDRDSLNEPLTKKVSSVRVFGEGVQGRRSVLFKVDRVEELPAEDEQFLERLAQLGDDPDAIQALARECRERAARFDDARLAAVGRQITLRELQVRTHDLPADDHAGRLALAQRYLDEAKDAAGAIALYGQVVEADAAAQVKARARARLDTLHAERVLRDDGAWAWIPYAEFKAAEGFVQRTDAAGAQVWRSREALELQMARAAELASQREKVELPRTNPVKHLKDAQRGIVARGQNAFEVRRAAGLPVRVRHERAPFLQQDDSVWTQWILKDGRRVYFVNGEVISVKAASAPYPG